MVPNIHVPICRSAKVYCGKMDDWIRMPFRVVRGVGQGTGVLDGVVIIEGEKAVLEVNLGRPIVTSGAFVTRCSQITLRTSFAMVWARVAKRRQSLREEMYGV